MKKSVAVIALSTALFMTACSGQTYCPTQRSVSSESSSKEAPPPVSSSAAPSSSSAPAVHESSDAEVRRLYTEASTYYTNSDYQNAINDCDAALKKDPLCYEAICIKAAAQYYSTGDPNEGLPLLDECIKLNPNYIYGYFNKALIYKGEKNWDVSISYFNKVISLDPNYAWSYYGISTIYADRNMVPQSLEYLKTAIEKDPSVKATARVQNHFDRMRDNKDFEALVK